eukprot:CAMPEP_0182464182 /NCGR_PEP_ID=MMETSP1319-20130603/8364_1 /TAXON_ID=172717 /ORGANISM="Bolidomonas pacifica, Strain RCC208" /LENGTH=63 /DNA_ID=CAMNT_0024663805 /DNA_START=40 /DNA_END=231 /DNA_ORIENTATION=+
MGAGASVDNTIPPEAELEIFKELRAKYQAALEQPDVDLSPLFDTLLGEYQEAIKKAKTINEEA